MLLEVILAAFIIAVAIGSLSYTSISYERALLGQKQRDMALVVARTEMEGCLKSRFGEMETNETAGVPRVIQFKRRVDGAQTLYPYSVEISVQILPDPNTKLVKVRTTYDQDDPKTIELSRMVYQTY